MMKYFSVLWLILTSSAVNAWGNHVVHYQGIARNGEQVAYVEKHTVEYSDSGKILEATTEYQSEAGKPIAELKSDFRESLTVPSHIMKNFRTGSVEGLRRDDGKVVLFDQAAGKPERTRTLEEADADGRVLVGCQGLNYYLLDHLGTFDLERELLIRFLIPGKLDYYDFKMKKVGESKDGILDFEVTIQNWFLKLFASKLLVKYDKRSKHIVFYDGLSNVQADDGGNQTVTITYNYEE